MAASTAECEVCADLCAWGSPFFLNEGKQRFRLMQKQNSVKFGDVGKESNAGQENNYPLHR
jgi:hypothetical protein